MLALNINPGQNEKKINWLVFNANILDKIYISAYEYAIDFHSTTLQWNKSAVQQFSKKSTKSVLCSPNELNVSNYHITGN